jgi:hypothetical protein
VWHPAPLFLTGISLASLMMFSGVPRLVSFDNRSAGSGTLSTPMVAPNDSEEDSVSSTQAHIVPAKFEVRPEGKTSASPQANTLAARAVADNDNKVAANSKTKLGKSAVIPAKTTQRPVNPPMLIRSTMSAEQAITPQTLILILQTGRYDAYGAVVWDLSVWRVTVMGPAQPGMEPGIVVKSI